MARKKSFQVKFKVDQRALNYFQHTAPEKLELARKNAVEAAGMVWSDEAKDITTNENHIDTSLYVNSIGYVTGSPASIEDTINETTQNGPETTLTIGSNVSYAGSLEKRYGIFARAIDLSQSRMNQVARAQVKRTLGLNRSFR